MSGGGLMLRLHYPYKIKLHDLTNFLLVELILVNVRLTYYITTVTVTYIFTVTIFFLFTPVKLL